MPRSPTVLLAIPANNDTMAPETRALLPGIRTLEVVLVPRPPYAMRTENVPAYADTMMAMIEALDDRRFDLAIHGCNAAGFLAGPTGNAEIARRMGEITAAPVVSTSGAMIEVLRHAGIGHTTVITPYLPEVNRGIVAQCEAGGIVIDRLASFETGTVAALARIGERDVLEKALATVTPQCQSLFIACSQLPSLGIVAELKRRLGIPVWSSVSATAWSAARVLSVAGFPISVAGNPALAA